MTTLRVTIFGAGRLGIALAAMLAPQPEFDVEVIDHSEEALDRLMARELAVTTRLVRHYEKLPAMLANREVTVSAVPAAARKQVADAAAMAGTHYLDFSPICGQVRDRLEELAKTRAVLGGCGVSPGFIDNMVHSLIRNFAPVIDLTIRVGSIPRFPTNRLGYGQIWNVDGLIEEYTQPSAAIRDRQPVTLEPLGEYERIIIDGVAYEGFTTAGGLEDLDWLVASGLRNVTFKTLRYPGHLEYMRFLLDDLGLQARRDMLRNLLLNGLPTVEDDVLLLVVTARGMRGSQMAEKTICQRFAPNQNAGPFNALTGVAAGYAATLLLMLANGEIAPHGFIPHRQVNMERLLSDRFCASFQRSSDLF